MSRTPSLFKKPVLKNNSSNDSIIMLILIMMKKKGKREEEKGRREEEEGRPASSTSPGGAYGSPEPPLPIPPILPSPVSACAPTFMGQHGWGPQGPRRPRGRLWPGLMRCPAASPAGGPEGPAAGTAPTAIPSGRGAHALCAQVINSRVLVTRSLRGRGALPPQ